VTEQRDAGGHAAAVRRIRTLSARHAHFIAPLDQAGLREFARDIWSSLRRVARFGGAAAHHLLTNRRAPPGPRRP